MIRAALTVLFCAVPLAAMAAGDGGALSAAAPLGILTLGFVVGLAHALDADHVAAVATMMGRGEGPARAIARGAVWGLGHTLSLFLICSIVLALGLTITGGVEATLELVVGVMIVSLGLRVLWKMHRDRVHIHVHEHGGTRHIHAHSHAAETLSHTASPHRHRHVAAELLPTLGVGLVHGAAGSAGLLVLIVSATGSYGQALLSFAVFGVGSLMGMAGLTAAASYPLGLIERGYGWMRTGLALTVAGFALLVGGGVISDSLGHLMAMTGTGGF